MPTSRFVVACHGALACAAVLLLASETPRAQAAAPATAAVVVNADVVPASIGIAQLRDILLGDRQHWAGRQRVIVFRPASGPEWEVVLSRALRMSASAYAKRLLTNRYAGELAEGPRMVDSTLEVRRLVARTSGGLGIVSAADVDASVKLLRIDGLAPGDAGYVLATRD
ncbi:MAG: hypothetical protein U0Q12_24390 [Vicinamibacterales bacterium]